MARLMRVLGGALTVVGVLSLGGATGLSGPYVKDATQFVGAAPISDAIGVVIEDEIGTSAVSVSEVGTGELGSQGGIGGPTLDMADDLGIPGTVLDAYKKAAQTANSTDPTCGIRWQILAGIGKVESNHAASGRLNAAGAAIPAILGPVLNGGGVASISDHDGGRWDGDSQWDRAVGPMQFIPATWKAYGVDGSGDGVPDPNNVYDATLAAANYLCADGADLSTNSGLTNALLRYNHSMAYVATVTAWIRAYDEGLVVTDDLGPVNNSPVPTGEVGERGSGNDKKNSGSTNDPEGTKKSGQTKDPDKTKEPDPTPKPDPTGPKPDTDPPTQIGSVTATAAGPNSIVLEWGAATDNVGVDIYQIKHGDGSVTEIDGASTKATIKGLASATAYEFRVRAVDAAGNAGSYSATASATTTDNVAPAQVGSVTATAAGPNSVELAWEVASDNVGVVGYEVTDGDGGLLAKVDGGSTTGVTIDGLDPATTYEFQVRAVDAAGNTGSYSATASATTTDADTGGTEDPNTSTTTRVTSPWRGRGR